jgi:hypothetical protein
MGMDTKFFNPLDQFKKNWVDIGPLEFYPAFENN